MPDGNWLDLSGNFPGILRIISRKHITERQPGTGDLSARDRRAVPDFHSSAESCAGEEYLQIEYLPWRNNDVFANAFENL